MDENEWARHILRNYEAHELEEVIAGKLRDFERQGIERAAGQREGIACVQHAIWAHWMMYMFTVAPLNADGSWTMPAEKVERWQRQMATDYADLTDKERESDRHQADKVIAVLRALK